MISCYFVKWYNGVAPHDQFLRWIAARSSAGVPFAGGGGVSHKRTWPVPVPVRA